MNTFHRWWKLHTKTGGLVKSNKWEKGTRKVLSNCHHAKIHQDTIFRWLMLGRTCQMYLFRLLGQLRSHGKQTALGLEWNRVKIESRLFWVITAQLFLSTSEWWGLYTYVQMNQAKWKLPSCFNISNQSRLEINHKFIYWIKDIWLSMIILVFCMHKAINPISVKVNILLLHRINAGISKKTWLLYRYQHYTLFIPECYTIIWLFC